MENRLPLFLIALFLLISYIKTAGRPGLMHYQMFHLRYKLTKEQLAALLHNEIKGVTALAEEFGGVSLADIHQDLISDYSLLYDRYIGPGQMPGSQYLFLCRCFLNSRTKLCTVNLKI